LKEHSGYPGATIELMAEDAGFQSLLLYGAGDEAARGVFLLETGSAAAGAFRCAFHVIARAEITVQPARADLRPPDIF